MVIEDGRAAEHPDGHCRHTGAARRHTDGARCLHRSQWVGLERAPERVLLQEEAGTFTWAAICVSLERKEKGQQQLGGRKEGRNSIDLITTAASLCVDGKVGQVARGAQEADWERESFGFPVARQQS